MTCIANMMVLILSLILRGAIGCEYTMIHPSWKLKEIKARLGDARTSASGIQDESRIQVEELAGRAFSLEALLDFVELLGTPRLMPQFDLASSTTNDVVREAIIPESRDTEFGNSIWHFMVASIVCFICAPIHVYDLFVITWQYGRKERMECVCMDM